MEPIGTANRSTSSMASSDTFGHAAMAGLTHGPKPISYQTIGAGITKFPKSILITTPLGGTSKRQTMPPPTVHQIWMKRIPSTRRWKILHQCRFINWLRFSGTFSTLTGTKTVAFWNDWRIPMKIFPDIRFRSLDQTTWPTLLAIWQLQLRH